MTRDLKAGILLGTATMHALIKASSLAGLVAPVPAASVAPGFEDCSPGPSSAPASLPQASWLSSSLHGATALLFENLTAAGAATPDPISALRSPAQHATLMAVLATDQAELHRDAGLSDGRPAPSALQLACAPRASLSGLQRAA
jgi:hypothetical protein